MEMGEEGVRYRIRIDPELRNLRSRTPKITAESAKDAAPFLLKDQVPRPQPVHFRLRRDGQRPLCFEGLIIMSLSLQRAKRLDVTFYLAIDDRVAVQIVESVGEARPRYLANFIASVHEPAEASCPSDADLTWEVFNLRSPGTRSVSGPVTQI